MIKYAVFDWDGTLADTYPAIVGGYRHVFETLDLPVPSREEIEEKTAKAQNKNVLSCFFDETQIKRAKDLYYQYINAHHLDTLKAVQGAKEVLDFCVNNKIEPRLMTNKKRPYLEAELKHLGFETYFAKIVCAGEYEYDKPHRVACEALFDFALFKADEVVVIGDGAADVEVAKVYGAKSIILGNKAKGDYQIGYLAQAIDIMKGL